MQKEKGAKKAIHMPSRERQQNHFIIGAIVGGLAAYWYTNGNIGSTIVVAVIAGIVAAIFWK